MVTARDLVGYLTLFVVAGGVVYYYNFRDRLPRDTESDKTNASQQSLHTEGVSNNADNTAASEDNDPVHESDNDLGENDLSDDLFDQLADADEQTVNEIYDNLSPELRARLTVRLEEFIDEEYEQFEREDRASQVGNNPFLPEDRADDIAGLWPEQINPRPTAGPSSSSRNANRIVGAKKTKSLARRDRIRAYNEYMRQQGEAERLAQREFERQYGDIIALARKDRQRREAEAQRLIKERLEQKRKEEEALRESEAQLKQGLQASLEVSGRARLNGDAEVQVAMQIPNAVVVSGGEWVVRLTDNHCRDLARNLKDKGIITAAELGEFMSGLY